MSRSTSKHRQHHRKKPSGKDQLGVNVVSDMSLYLGFVLIGGAVVVFSWLAFEGHATREIALGYLIAMALLVHLYAFRVYLGARLANWQQALARLPLRCAGFGTHKGKPLEAAHGSKRAMSMIWISLAVSIVVLCICAWLLLPSVRTSLTG